MSKSTNRMNKRVNTEHVKAKTKALEAVPTFVVKKTKNTVLVTTRKNFEVFLALKMGRGIDLWTVSYVTNLFGREG